MRYFIGKDGKQLGPFSDEQVRAMLKTGEISYDDLGWHEGMTQWKPLRSLFSNFSATPFNPPGMRTSAAPFNPAAADAATPPAAESFSEEPRLAGRGTRLGAILLDQLFAFILALPGLWMLFQPFIQDIKNGQTIEPEQLAGQLGTALPILIIPLLAFVVVQVVLLVKNGQTIGKKLLGIKIVKLDGSNPGFVSVILLRSILPGIIGGIPMVGPLFSLVNVLLIFREDRRCIHDMMAGTIVVEA